MNRENSYLPFLASIGFAVIFGFSFMFSKIALEYATVLQLIGLRFLFAMLIFQLLRLFKVLSINIQLKDLKVLIPIAIFQPVVYFLGETFGISFSSSSMAGIVISLIPVVTAILSFLILKESLTKIQMLFLVLSLIGILLIGCMSLLDFKIDMLLGLLFLMVAVLGGSIYSVFSRKASKEFSSVEITYIMMLLGAVVFNIIGIFHAKLAGYSYFAPILNLRFDIAIVFLGGLSSVIAFFLMNYSLSKMPATQVALFANLITVISIIAGVVILKEHIFIYQIIGSVLIIIGVWGVNHFKTNHC